MSVVHATTKAMFGSVILLQPWALLMSVGCVTNQVQAMLVCGLCCWLKSCWCPGAGLLPGTVLVSVVCAVAEGHVDAHGLYCHQAMLRSMTQLSPETMWKFMI